MTARIGDRQPVLPKISTPISNVTGGQRPSAGVPLQRTVARQPVDQFQPAATTRQAALAPDAPTDDKINKLIDDNFKAVYGEERAPTPAERSKWMAYARDLRAQGHGANHIKQMMMSGIGAAKNGLADTSDSSLNTIINDNFKAVYGEERTPTAAERSKWMGYAKQLAAQGHGANHIKQMMLSSIGAEKAGVADTSTNSLNTIIDDNFKAVFGEERTPTAAERSKWMDYAKRLAAQGHGANHIKQMMLSSIGAEKAGVADTSTNSLNTMIDDNFKAVFGEERKPTAAERSKWMDYAKRLAAQGHGANHIKQMMVSEIGKEKAGLADTSTNSLNTIIDDNFKAVFGDERVPTAAERSKWMDYAKRLAAQGHGANHIKQMMMSEINATKVGTDISDSGLNKMIDENFQAAYSADRKPTDAERSKWLAYARQLRSEGHGANHIRQMMLSGIGQDK